MPTERKIESVEEHVDYIDRIAFGDRPLQIQIQRARDRAIAEAAWKLGYGQQPPNKANERNPITMQRDLDALLGNDKP